jgi:hypothetical protein
LITRKVGAVTADDTATADVVPNNPAARLLALVRVLAGSNPDLAAKEIWAAVLNAPASDAGRLFSQLAKVLQLVDSAEAVVRSLPGVNYGLYLSWLPEIRQLASYTNLDVPWRSYQPHLKAEVLQGIAFCDDLLRRNHACETSIPEDELRSIREEARRLLLEVTEARMPPDLRAYVIQHLEAVIRAIDDYPLLGADPLRQVLSEALGAVVITEEVRDRGADEDLVKKTWGLLARIATVLNIGQAATQLTTTILALTAGNLPHPH